MPGEVSRSMPAADLSPEEHEEFEIWRRSREAIARALADVEEYPVAEHYETLADHVLLALTTADLVIKCRQDAADDGHDFPPCCEDPDCDGDLGHDGPHFQWIPE